jgi:hypothetical protein
MNILRFAQNKLNSLGGGFGVVTTELGLQSISRAHEMNYLSSIVIKLSKQQSKRNEDPEKYKIEIMCALPPLNFYNCFTNCFANCVYFLFLFCRLTRLASGSVQVTTDQHPPARSHRHTYVYSHHISVIHHCRQVLTSSTIPIAASPLSRRPSRANQASATRLMPLAKQTACRSLFHSSTTQNIAQNLFDT